MWWSWILAALGISTMFFAGKHKWWAWPIGIVAEILWIIYSVTTHQYGFIIASIAYIIIYIKNTHYWKKGEEDGIPAKEF